MSTAPLAVRLPAGRPYYGWVLVAALAVTQTASYGVLVYAFPVFLVPMERELGFSRLAMTGAFSLAMLVAGMAAVPAGRWVDRHGARSLMTAGSVAAALLLVAWSGVESLAGFYAIWVGIGLASAAVLYEPAFAVLATWFQRLRSRALTLLTFGGGFASVIFVPLSAWLVAGQGWRAALLWLAALYAVLTVLPHGLLLRRRPSDLGLEPDGGRGRSAEPRPSARPSTPARQATRSRSFALLATAFALSSFVTTAAMIHLIPLLMERGYGVGLAGAATGAIGLAALPGRLVLTPLGTRWPRQLVTAAIFGMQLLGLAALLVPTSPAALWTFVLLFGAGFGAITPARAALVAEFYGAAEYGAISGTLALLLSVSRAAAPVGASLLHLAGGGYPAVLWTLVALTAGSALAILTSGERLPDHGRRALELAA